MKTEKGTELPIISLRGKEYLEVKYRLVWFREHHPDWGIETEFVHLSEKAATVKATIRDHSGRVVATSHKREDEKGFPDFQEKAETGAIGRALALCGFGTQFCADDLDEKNRIVDAPVEPKSPSSVTAVPRNQTAMVTDFQLTQIYDRSKKMGWTTANLVAYSKKKFGVEESKYLSWHQAQELVQVLEKYKFDAAFSLLMSSPPPSVL